MISHRLLRSILTFLAASLLCAGLSACKKQPFVQVVEQTLYLGMPANIETLASVDMEQLRLTDGVMDTLKQMETNPKGKEQEQYKAGMEALRQQIGFDPWKDINRLVLGTRGQSDAGKNVIILARGQFQNAPEKLKKLADWLGEDVLADPKVTRSQHSSGIPTIRISGKNQRNVKETIELNFAFPNDTLLVFSPSSQQLGDALDVISGQMEGIQKDKNWLEMLKRPNTGAAIWATGALSPATAKELAGGMPTAADQLKGVKQAFLDVNFNPGFALNIGLVCENIDAATKLSAALRTQFEQIKTFGKMMLAAQQSVQTAKILDNIKILSELETARVSLALSADDQRLLRDEWQKLSDNMKPGQLGLPGLSGGMPGGGGMPFPMPGAAK